MFVTLDTSHLEMSLLNLFVPGITSSLNNWRILVTAETSQDPIGPCGPLEHSVDSFRHSKMAAWSSTLDFGGHPGVGITGGTVGDSERITIMIRAKVRFRVIRVMTRVRGAKRWMYS